MKLRIQQLVTPVLFLALVAAMPAEAKKRKKKAEEAKAPAEATALSEAEVMALGEPSREHQMLERLVGTWDVMGKAYMPGGEVVEMGGTMVNAMILGGRFLESEYQGTLMGQKFWGRGLEGYDRVSDTHFSQWIDSMSTQLISYKGDDDESGKVRTLYGERVDPSTGKTIREKSVTTIKSHSTYTYEAWADYGDGELETTMRIVFSKRSDESGTSKGER